MSRIGTRASKRNGKVNKVPAEDGNQRCFRVELDIFLSQKQSLSVAMAPVSHRINFAVFGQSLIDSNFSCCLAAISPFSFFSLCNAAWQLSCTLPFDDNRHLVEVCVCAVERFRTLLEQIVCNFRVEIYETVLIIHKTPTIIISVFIGSRTTRAWARKCVLSGEICAVKLFSFARFFFLVALSVIITTSSELLSMFSVEVGPKCLERKSWAHFTFVKGYEKLKCNFQCLLDSFCRFFFYLANSTFVR